MGVDGWNKWTEVWVDGAAVVVDDDERWREQAKMGGRPVLMGSARSNVDARVRLTLAPDPRIARETHQLVPAPIGLARFRTETST
jgi:hypothetical protein